jgi:sodium-dependent dicarboxylate transporter 2/3/5
MQLVILNRRNIKALAILAVALTLGALVSRLQPAGLSEAGRITLGIFTVAAVLWMLEPFPLYVTSFLVVILEVVFLAKPGGPLGLDAKGYTIFLDPFFDPVVVLFLGGFVLARAVKRYELDERISHLILRRSGSEPKRVLLGMMITSAFLSMWISNTATTALMIAAAIPIVRTFDKDEPFRKAIILGIPFASNIGGIGTPIGTPPNAVAIGILAQLGQRVTFLQWMLRGIPVVVVLLALCWYMLCRLYPPSIAAVPLRLGKDEPLDRRSTFVVAVFGAVVVLWLTSGIHGVPSAIVALLPLVVFFGLGLLEHEDLEDLGWGILFIIGGGMSLGVAMRESGLSAWIVHQVPFEGMGVLVILLVFAAAAAVLTTFISNTATANLLIPIVIGVASVAPRTSAVVVAIASSAAMILPISTPPNAIAYGSGQVRVSDMMKAGGLITAVSVVFIAVFVHFVF